MKASVAFGPFGRRTSFDDTNAKQALVCDEENFSFPEECCLQPLRFIFPKEFLQPTK